MDVILEVLKAKDDKEMAMPHAGHTLHGAALDFAKPFKSNINVPKAVIPMTRPNNQGNSIKDNAAESTAPTPQEQRLELDITKARMLLS